jgi:hypothetical protein
MPFLLIVALDLAPKRTARCRRSAGWLATTIIATLIRTGTGTEESTLLPQRSPSSSGT